jgi:hypothetical protein
MLSNVLSFPHQITRLVFDAGQPYEKIRSRYEATVPSAYPQRLGESAGRHARWHETTADADAPSPSGFVLYWRLHMTPTMTTAGDMRPCTAYLMGLHAIPEDIYRRDPAVLLYTPLRTLIYIDGDDRTRFAVDQPSAVFAGFADLVIAEHGLELDRQLARLLDTLGVEPSLLPAVGALAVQRTGRHTAALVKDDKPATRPVSILASRNADMPASVTP